MKAWTAEGARWYRARGPEEQEALLKSEQARLGRENALERAFGCLHLPRDRRFGWGRIFGSAYCGRCGKDIDAIMLTHLRQEERLLKVEALALQIARVYCIEGSMRDVLFSGALIDLVGLFVRSGLLEPGSDPRPAGDRFAYGRLPNTHLPGVEWEPDDETQDELARLFAEPPRHQRPEVYGTSPVERALASYGPFSMGALAHYSSCPSPSCEHHLPEAAAEKLAPAGHVTTHLGVEITREGFVLEPERETVNSATCSVCGRGDHEARIMDGGGLECPARVIRILPEAGSAVPGSDPGVDPVAPLLEVPPPPSSFREYVGDLVEEVHPASLPAGTIVAGSADPLPSKEEARDRLVRAAKRLYKLPEDAPDELLEACIDRDPRPLDAFSRLPTKPVSLRQGWSGTALLGMTITNVDSPPTKPCPTCGRPCPEGWAVPFTTFDETEALAAAGVVCRGCLRAPDGTAWDELPTQLRARYWPPEVVDGREILCPTCEGAGECAGDYSADDGMSRCETCEGKGTVPAPDLMSEEETQRRLRAFEEQYGMPTATFVSLVERGAPRRCSGADHDAWLILAGRGDLIP